MRFALNVPNFGTYGDPRTVADLARDGEGAGWDGFFVWDHILGFRDGQFPLADPWILLAAIAMRTDRIRIGPMVTPVPRRRPWKLARETVTLDHLSGGRLVLGVGLGFPPDAEFEAFGEDGSLGTRAARLDEGLDIVAGLWSGEPFSHEGRHYRVDRVTFLPRPIQRPRIPVWVAGLWPHRAAFRRAARWDGAVPLRIDANGGMTNPGPEDVREIRSFIDEHRPAGAPYDVVAAGETPGDDPARAADTVGPFAEAGATWWSEGINDWRGDLEAMRKRVRQGPPRA